MTANAIAAKLGKKLLLVNFPLLNKQSEKDDANESKFQSIFREAELSDAIIFFDECESLFSKRSSGGSAGTTELLTELERFEGIVFLVRKNLISGPSPSATASQSELYLTCMLVNLHRLQIAPSI